MLAQPAVTERTFAAADVDLTDNAATHPLRRIRRGNHITDKFVSQYAAIAILIALYQCRVCSTDTGQAYADQRLARLQGWNGIVAINPQSVVSQEQCSHWHGCLF